MTNKLVVIINSVKVPKIKKILLYEMKFLVPNYSCLQNPWLGGYRPQIPVLSVLCPQLNLLNNPPPRTKFLGTPLKQCLVLTSFPRQPWLRERSSMLRWYVRCLSCWSPVLKCGIFVFHQLGIWIWGFFFFKGAIPLCMVSCLLC